MNDEERAQRWHDTDHPSPPPEDYSSCWCCCNLCDPDISERPNPWYLKALQELTR